jgi:predicted PurR-regulated permease PerM
MVWVLLLYAVVHAIDGYAITPLVQRQAIAMPPALQILVQIIFGILAGGLGIVLATPILACLMVLIEMLYIDDIRGGGEVHEVATADGLVTGDGKPSDGWRKPAPIHP